MKFKIDLKSWYKNFLYSALLVFLISLFDNSFATGFSIGVLAHYAVFLYYFRAAKKYSQKITVE